MKPYSAYELLYETMEMLGQTVLFTDMRVDRTTVPEGLHAYSLRHDDDCQGDICEIAPSVMVNFWGTILCRKEILLTNNGRRYVDENDYNYTGDSMNIEEYMAQDSGQGEEKEQITEQKKPDCPLIGQNGNVFNLIGIASQTLRRAGMPEQAKEMSSRISSEAHSYDEALGIIMEYVNVTSVDEEPEEEMDLGVQ